MATMTVDCGSFDKTSYNGATQYGSVVNFSIPAGAIITECSVTFTTHAASGQTNDRAFSLNGVRAHPDWPSSGMSLNASLLSPGNNTFRVTLKSRTASGSEVVSCTWNISGITLYITYNDGGGGGGPPVGGGGPVVITPSSIDAGAGSVTVTCPAEAGIWHWIDWTFGTQSGSWSHPWEAGGTETISIPLSWIAEMPSATSKTLAIRVRRSGTPSEPYSFATDQTINVTIKVPASVVPSISNFTATLVPNGVPGTIAGYVQNKSKVALAMTAAGGSYSPIASYSITGGGISSTAASGTFGPFNLSGDLVFTAKVTDGRGRTATRQVAIEIMPYTAPAFSSPEAWRSNYDGVKNQKGTYARLKSGARFSSLEGQNAVTLKGRVYIKGGAAPAWETMTPDTELILGGGALLFTRTYIAQIQVSDLLESRITEFIIPTKKTGISIMAGMQGIAFGKTVEIPGITESAWPIVAPGIPPNPNLLHNWDFRNPVNQRGVTGALAYYGLDRWIHVGESYYTPGSGYIQLYTGARIDQKVEGPLLNGKVVTLSVWAEYGLFSQVYTVSPGNGSIIFGGGGIRAWVEGYATYTFVQIEMLTGTKIYAVKLELGPVSTLHLDPPMDHASEYIKCRRFYVKQSGLIPGAISYATNLVYIYVPLSTPMRANPSLITTTGSLYTPNNGVVGFSNAIVNNFRQSDVELMANPATEIAIRTSVLALFDNGGVALSADL